MVGGLKEKVQQQQTTIEQQQALNEQQQELIDQQGIAIQNLREPNPKLQRTGAFFEKT